MVVHLKRENFVLLLSLDNLDLHEQVNGPCEVAGIGFLQVIGGDTSRDSDMLIVWGDKTFEKRSVDGKASKSLRQIEGCEGTPFVECYHHSSKVNKFECTFMALLYKNGAVLTLKLDVNKMGLTVAAQLLVKTAGEFSLFFTDVG